MLLKAKASQEEQEMLHLSNRLLPAEAGKNESIQLFNDFSLYETAYERPI